MLLRGSTALSMARESRHQHAARGGRRADTKAMDARADQRSVQAGSDYTNRRCALPISEERQAVRGRGRIW